MQTKQNKHTNNYTKCTAVFVVNVINNSTSL